jgi:hypothetical protein
MSGSLKLNTPSAGSVTLSPADTASNVTVTIPASTATLVNASSTQTLTNKTLTAAGGNTVEATSGPTSTQLAGMRNKIINGAMMIDQRNAGASVTITNTSAVTYTLDRWGSYGSAASKFSIQQNAGSVASPSGFSNYLGVTSLSAYSVPSGEQFTINQAIEGFNTADLMWGTASAATVTLSFWVRSSLTGTFGGALRNSAENRAYPFSYTINTSNTWEQKTITVAGDTSGTWLTNNGVGIRVFFGLGVGSSASGTAGAWAAAGSVSATGAVSVVGTNGATFYITGVQLEKGATATPFENRLYGTELALCQRYCVKYDSSTSAGTYYRYGIGECASTTRVDNILQFFVPMRATPSLTTTGTASNYALFSATVITACSVVPSISIQSNPLVATTDWFVASGLTAGRAAQCISNNNNTSYLLFTAEL